MKKNTFLRSASVIGASFMMFCFALQAHAGNAFSGDFEKSSGQYLSISDANQTGLDITGDLTLEAWVKVEEAPSGGQNYIITGKYIGGSVEAYVLGYRDDSGLKIHFQTSETGTGTGNANYFDWPVDLGEGEFHHLAAVFDSSTADAELFVDGVSQGVEGGTYGTIANTSAPFVIGAAANPTVYFDGIIDDVRVWNDERTSSEIEDNMYVMLTGSEANLQGYWKLDGNTNDSTANDNDLTNNNGVSFVTQFPYEFDCDVSPFGFEFYSANLSESCYLRALF